MKRLVFLPLLLLLVMVLIPGCVTVKAPVEQPSVIGSFSSSPDAINPGGTSNLVWNVTGANSVSIDNGIGIVNAVGVREISPAVSTVYTLSATNSAGTVIKTARTIVNPAPPNTVAFLVTKVVASIAPLTYTGTCPKTFVLSAAITANGPGIATYRWEREDLRYSGVQSVTFDAAGTQTSTINWDFSETTSGWIRAHVLTGDLTSIPVYYTLVCNGG